MLNQRRISQHLCSLVENKTAGPAAGSFQVPVVSHFMKYHKGVYPFPLLVFMTVSFVLPNNIYHSLEVSNYILSLPSPVFRRDRGRYYIKRVPVNSWISVATD